MVNTNNRYEVGSHGFLRIETIVDVGLRPRPKIDYDALISLYAVSFDMFS